MKSLIYYILIAVISPVLTDPGYDDAAINHKLKDSDITIEYYGVPHNENCLEQKVSSKKEKNKDKYLTFTVCKI